MNITINIVATRHGRRQSGFSLLELMMVVAIVGILASIAYPSFMQNARKSNRADAKMSLLRAAGNQERFFATSLTYTNDVTKLGFPANGLSEKEYYVISAAAGATGIGSSYILTATAITGTMQEDDTNCTVLSVDSLGARLPDPATSKCW
jgi:type IV pilus assembly protein PilE